MSSRNNVTRRASNNRPVPKNIVNGVPVFNFGEFVARPRRGVTFSSNVRRRNLLLNNGRVEPINTIAVLTNNSKNTRSRGRTVQKTQQTNEELNWSIASAALNRRARASKVNRYLRSYSSPTPEQIETARQDLINKTNKMALVRYVGFMLKKKKLEDFDLSEVPDYKVHHTGNFIRYVVSVYDEKENDYFTETYVEPVEEVAKMIATLEIAASVAPLTRARAMYNEAAASAAANNNAMASSTHESEREFIRSSIAEGRAAAGLPPSAAEEDF